MKEIKFLIWQLILRLFISAETEVNHLLVNEVEHDKKVQKQMIKLWYFIPELVSIIYNFIKSDIARYRDNSVCRDRV